MKVIIKLGKPWAPPGMTCIYCGQPATRSASGMEGSVTRDGVRQGFKETGISIHFCDNHGIITREVMG